MTKIYNRTPHKFTLISAKGVNDAWGRSAKADPSEIEVLSRIQPEPNPANVSLEIVDAGEVGGIPAKKTKWGEITDLPASQEGVYHIVSLMVVSAAQETGRTTSDILTVAGAVRDVNNPSAIVGALGVNRN